MPLHVYSYDSAVCSSHLVHLSMPFCFLLRCCLGYAHRILPFSFFYLYTVPTVSITYVCNQCGGNRKSLRDVVSQLDEIIDHQGLRAVASLPAGNLARPRKFELAAAINRLRSMKVVQ
mmetsp:Transcript_40781/g.105817  ORF Transcript_40781/g.105817 Transcript_40781/m.105817 type:complete len:118 (+) Transcript_40781:1642-1995(+)